MSAPGTFVTAAPSSTRALSYSLTSIIFLVLLCLSYSINAADRQIFPTLLPAIRDSGRWRFHGPTVRRWLDEEEPTGLRRRLLSQREDRGAP